MPEISVLTYIYFTRLYISAVSEVFADLPQESQFIELMSNPLHYKIISKFMYTILNQRQYLLYL